MKISDLLGYALDLFDSPESGKQAAQHIGGSEIEIQNRPDVHSVQADHEDNTDQSKMVAPLQQKLELLKRAVGVDNFYDSQESEEDELNQILKIAGVPTASIFDAGDDEPLDS